MSDILDVIRQEVEAREISKGVKVNSDKCKQTFNQMKIPSAAHDPRQLEPKLNVHIVVAVIIQPPATCKVVWKFYEKI